MSKRTVANKKIVKSFADISIKDRTRLLADLRILTVVHNGEAEKAFEPKTGTFLHDLWSQKHFDIRQQRAWKTWRHECDIAEGKSGGVTFGYGEFTDGGENDFKVPKAYDNYALTRCRDILERYLGRRDAKLLADLTQYDMGRIPELSAEQIGVVRSGFNKVKLHAKIAGIVNVQSLLTRLADYYTYGK
jgi:hypothetical protein